MHVWNNHKISISKKAVAIADRPHNLWHLYKLYKVKNYAVPVPEADIRNHSASCIFQPLPCDEEIYRYCSSLMEQNNMKMPETATEGKELYLWLKQQLNP